MTSHPPRCQHPNCHKKAYTHYKLEPRNWTERRMILCPDHARTLGYSRVNYERPAVHGTYLSGRERRSGT